VGEESSETGEHMAIQNFSSTVPSFMQGGYTSLLLGLDQEASAARKLHFDEPGNDTTFED
jgi:hypothetical protein